MSFNDIYKLDLTISKKEWFNKFTINLLFLCGFGYFQRLEHNNIQMSARLSRWKEVKSTGDKLNKTLDIKIPDIPSKFAPKRDRSESVDKLFNDSRSRAHSSVELSVLNKSR